MTEKRFKMKKLEYDAYFIDSQQEYVDEYVPKFEIDGEKTMSDSQILDLLNENEQLKKQIEEYTNPDKYILIKKTENSTEEYNSCPDCQHYEREYEEVIAFGEYETLTKEICNKGHDIEDTDANKCNDYEYNEFW